MGVSAEIKGDLSRPCNRSRGRPPGVRNRPRVPVPDGRLVLEPFSVMEAVDVPYAAAWARVSQKCMREWCERFAIGRKVAGRWWVSRFALPMLLANDHASLAVYHSGRWENSRVMDYVDRMLSTTVQCGQKVKKPEKPRP